MPRPPLPTYAIVSPVRDEAEHLARTAEALLAQSHPPAAWVIVDDGSTDGTNELAQRYAGAVPWIHVIRAASQHDRARGAPIVRAFNLGRGAIDVATDVIVKLDGDLYLPPHYFAWVLSVFADDPRAGVVGGVALVADENGRWVPDEVGIDTVNGVAKAYRCEALDEIGGLPASMGWDGIDEFALRARGWSVRVLTELPILHYRRRGSRQRWWKARWEEGRGCHFMGYRWSFVVLRAGYRMLVERPPLLGGLVLGAGFAWSAIRRRPQMPDADARALLRSEQRERLGSLLTRRRRPPDPLPGGGPAYTCTEPDARIRDT
jgi:biofilm PGA synthesis N-glycosyltransferase PgaC